MAQINFCRDTGLGRVIMAGLPGTSLDTGTMRLIREYGVSNFIIFSRNTTDGLSALADLCGAIRATCKSENLEPLISIDQEGGPVRRLKPPLYPDIISAADVLSSEDPLAAMAELAKQTARTLAVAGITMNLAPVLDLCLEAEKNVLQGRCFGSEPREVAVLGQTYIRELQKNGILATAKHFPGIGRVRLDPHLERPTVNASLEELACDLIPFQEAIRTGISAVMTSHVIYRSIDALNPATFSKGIATKLLRIELGFKGLLLTDDLEMKGITKHGKIDKAAVDAFLSGHDLLLVCNSQDKVSDCLQSLARALEAGLITMERLQGSLKRIQEALSMTKKNTDTAVSNCKS